MAIEKDKIQLSTLVDMLSPDSVMAETRSLLVETVSEINFAPIETVFKDTVALFEGRYPGYHACNTEYHNLGHTLDNVMAFARLVHGAGLSGESFKEHPIKLGIISSFLHDSGYIQTTDDNRGTGAKYTSSHVERSTEFACQYLKSQGYSESDINDVAHMILATDIKITQIPFTSPEMKTMGLMVGTSDLIGQMADRTYLEKLLFLYIEFKEGNIPGYDSEHDMLVKTTHFYELVKKRLEKDLGNVKRFMLPHFQKRWNIDFDLYHETIERNMNYLKDIVAKKDYRNYLRRGNLVKILEEKKKDTK